MTLSRVNVSEVEELAVTLGDYQGRIASLERAISRIGGGLVTGPITGSSIRLTGTGELDLASTGHPFQIGPSAGVNLGIDTDEIQARINGAVGVLSLNPHGGSIQLGGGGTPYQQVRIGDDAHLADVNTAHTIALVSNSDSTQGRLKLGSAGPSLIGLASYYQLQSPNLGYYDANVHYFRNAAGVDKANIDANGMLSLNRADESVRLQQSGAYIAWWAGARLGYIQGNTGQLYMNTDGTNTLRLRGGGGLFLDNGAANYQLTQSVIGNRVVATDASGYIFGNYINMSADASYTSPTWFAGQNGDSFLRWYAYCNANQVQWGSTPGSIMSTKISGSSWGDVTFSVNPGTTMATITLHPGGVAGMFRIQQNDGRYHCNNTAGDNYFGIIASAFTPGSSLRYKQEVTPLVSTLPALPVNPVAAMVRALRPVWFRHREEQLMMEIPPMPDGWDQDVPWIPPVEDNYIHFCRAEGPGNCGHTPDDPCMWRANWMRGQLGFIAEEVEAVLPQLVQLDKDDTPQTIDLGSFVGLAYAMLQELDNRLTTLEGAP